MEERLERENLEVIKIPADKIVWYEEGKELLVNGRMFDVKEITFVDELAIISGLFDEKEKAIHESLQSAIDEENDQRSKNNFLTGFNFVFNDHAFEIPIYKKISLVKAINLFTTVSLNRVSLPVPTPPPNLA